MGYVYEQSSIGTGANQVIFNSFTIYPVYRMKQRAVTKREIEEFDIKLPEGTGDADFQTFIGKSYFVIQGTMFGKDRVSFDAGKRALRKLASLDVSQADALSDQGYAPYKWSDADYDKQLFVKVMYADVPESSSNGGRMPFRLLCKVKYPVIFSQVASTAVIGSATATTSGTSNLPFTLPRAIGLTSYSSSGTVVNNGDMPTYPQSIVITGPITTPRITNSTTGKYIELTVNLTTTGDTVIITYDQDSLSITQGGVSVLNQLTAASTFFKLSPGNNTLTLTGATVGSGATASISCLSAWPLS